MSMYRCAACGSPNVVVDTQAGGIGYNFVKGAVGTVALGLGGAAAGIESKKQQVFKCPDCGITLSYCMPYELKCLIDAGVSSSSARNHLAISLHGTSFPMNWEILKQQYKNIESGMADQEISDRQMSLSSLATATKEEFDRAIDIINEEKQRYYNLDDKQREKENSLTRYLSLLSAVKLVIENMAVFLPTSSSVVTAETLFAEYRGIRIDEFGELFMTYLDEELKKYLGYDGSHILVYPNSTTIHDEYLSTHPFLYSLMDRYSNTVFHECSRDYESNTFRMRTSPHFFLKKHQNTITVKIDGKKTFPGYKFDYTLAFNIPRFRIKEGRLGFWDYSYKANTPGKPINYKELIENYFNHYPDRKKDFDQRLAEFNEKNKDYQKLQSSLDQAQIRIGQIDNKISANHTAIQKYESKIFGKKAARAAADQLKLENEDLLKEKISEEEKIDVAREAQRPNLHELITSLIDDYEAFVVWKWVDEDYPVLDANTINGTEKTDLSHEVVDSTFQGQTLSAATEIREFKQLLDDGIITQEEFDVKKKQLLGL